jgi:hypothetical protein
MLILEIMTASLFIPLLQTNFRYQKALETSYISYNAKNAVINDISNQCQDFIQSQEQYIGNLSDDNKKCANDMQGLIREIIDCKAQKNQCEQNFENMPFLKEMNDWSGTKTYDRFSFNCVDYARGCASLARNLGYDAYVRAVHVNCSTLGCQFGNGHAITILELPIDCTNGLYVIPPSLFEAYGLNSHLKDENIKLK